MEYILTDSENKRMVGVGRDLCGSSSSTSLSKQGHLQQAAQDLVQAGLEYLQRRRLHHHLGQPVPVLHHAQREEVLPHVRTELPVLQFVPIAPCPVAGHHCKEFGPILLSPTLQILCPLSAYSIICILCFFEGKQTLLAGFHLYFKWSHYMNYAELIFCVISWQK